MIKRITTEAAALILLLLLWSADASAQQYHYKLNFSLSAEDFADTITISVDQGRVYVPVTIGEHTYRFMLDTGAGMGGVYTDTRINGMKPIGHITSHDANGRSHTTQVVSLPPLQLGNLTVRDYHVNVIDRPPGAKNADGIVGFDIFNKGLLGKIDVRQKHLILTDRKTLFRNEPGYASRYRLNRHVPHVTISPFEGFNENVRFDTGDREFYSISHKAFEHASQSVDRRLLDTQIEGRTFGCLRISHYGAETNDEVVALCLSGLQWGNFRFSKVRALTTQGNSTIGAALLAYGSVIINPFRRRLIFQPFDGGNGAVVGNNLPDIYYIPDHGRAAVGLVWEYSEAYQRGFRQGDIIERINNTPINDFRQFLAYPFIIGQSYTYTVRDKWGHTKQVRLTK
ncbi:MAG: aspartyl protease family protein [Prevotella sp.]|nr:aspartyl protease family protein [Prevotella sp.]